MEEKARVTLRFLACKEREYVKLKAEIEELQREARAGSIDELLRP
jgi:hypothetical protein